MMDGGDENEEEAAKQLKRVLRNMSRSYWGGVHMDFDDIRKRMKRSPPEAKDLVEEFFRRSPWILRKPSTGKFEVSLNSKFNRELLGLVEAPLAETIKIMKENTNR